MAANINLLVNVDNAKAIEALNKLEAKAKLADNAMKQLKVTAADFSKVAGFQKTIAEAEKMNKALNSVNETTKKTSTQMDKFADHFARKMSVAALSIMAIQKAFSLVSQGLHAGFDYAVDSYEKAVELNKQKVGLQQLYKEEKKDDKLIVSVDNLASQLQYLGIKLADTYEAAKTFAMIFPKANEAATTNFLTAAGVMASAKFHGNIEQASQSLLMMESSLQLGRKPGILQMKKAGLDEDIAEYLYDLVKKKKKGGKVPSVNEQQNILEEELTKRNSPVAKAMAMADPLSYFKVQMDNIGLTLGRSLITAFQSKGVQDLLDDLTKKLNNFILALTPEKITGVIEDIINFGTTLMNVGLSIAQFISEHLSKSSVQINRENSYINNLIRGDSALGEAYQAAISGGGKIKNAAEYNQIPGQDIQKYLEDYRKDKTSVNDKSVWLKEFIKLLDEKYTLGAFKFGPGDNATHDINAPKGGAKGADKNVKNKTDLEFKNETAGVTGNKATTININIQDQIKELTINSANLDEALDKIEDKIIEALNDAILSAESIVE